MLESTDGDREYVAPMETPSSGGKEVWRRCDGPAEEGLRRFEADVVSGDMDGRFLEVGRATEVKGGEPWEYGGDDAIMCNVVSDRREEVLSWKV